MCGIVGYIGDKKAAPILLEGLKKLEYRGYDSAGLAVYEKGKINLIRSEGKLANLYSKIQHKHGDGTVGIGHTRWATHGKPVEKNAHPHKAGRVVLVHNGIIENYDELKKLLPHRGRELKSETDTEIIAHLINQNLRAGGSFVKALRKTLNLLRGTYALVIMDEADPQALYLAKKASPLVVGAGEGETFVASDIPALLPYTRRVLFLETNEIAICKSHSIEIYDQKQKRVERKFKTIQWTAEMAEKGGHKHFMFKEIMEQPQVIHQSLLGRLNVKHGHVVLPELDRLFKNIKPAQFHRIYFVACGTSWHAALAGKYYLEAIARLPVSVDMASEFRYREPFIDKHTLVLVISQSGETADTLACVQQAKEQGAMVISVCNVMEASIPRLADATLYTYAGPEIGVASTKAFTSQLLVLLLFSLYMGQKNRIRPDQYVNRAMQQFKKLADQMNMVLQNKNQILKIAEQYLIAQDFYFIARGIHYPVALEGALKLKEISYIHAEGYSAGEMKHGPIALIEPGTPVVALAPQDRVCEKMISNIQEMKSRGASIIVVATEGDRRFQKLCEHVISVPKAEWYATPLLVSLPMQLLAYYIADLKGTDVDQPRNLAKSVTVE